MMPKYCTQCGTQISDGQRFCAKCGHKINTDSRDKNYHSTTQNTVINDRSNSRNNHRSIPIKWSSLVLLIFVAIWAVRYFGPKINTSWAVDAACTEVKSEAYRDYGEIPRVSGELIYHNGQDYIVVVKYELPELKWEASRACLVYGYRESNCYVSRMTKEMSRDYNYKANLNELKALWALK